MISWGRPSYPSLLMIPIRNLARNKVRNIITIVGIAGGVGVFVAVSSVTHDLGGQIRDASKAYDMDVVVQQAKAASPFFSRLTIDDMEVLEGLFKERVAPLVIGSLRESWNQYAFLIGIKRDTAGRVPLVSGRLFNEGAKEMIMGAHSAQRLGIEVGARISAGGEEWRVVGVFRTGSRLIDGGMMVDISEAMRVLGGRERQPIYNLALVNTGGPEKTQSAIELIRLKLPHLRAVRSLELGGMLRIFNVIKTLSNTITALSLLGVCLIVTNTLLMGIAERTGEIGILMALGWRPTTILRMLLLETLFLSIAGTLLGNLLGAGLLHAVNHMRVVDFGWIPLGIGLFPFLSSLAAAAFVALMSLLWPAFVVMRIRPAEALRHVR